MSMYKYAAKCIELRRVPVMKVTVPGLKVVGMRMLEQEDVDEVPPLIVERGVLE
jgi:hypothetical protein